MGARLRTPAVVALATMMVTAAPAAADASPDRHGDSDAVTTSAACGSIATTLVLRPRNGGIEVEYELDQNRPGRTWRLSLSRNGAVAARSRQTTTLPSGSLVWRLLVSEASRSDAITVTARRGTTTCTISSGQPATGSSATSDTITVSKCFTNATASTGGELLIKASSSDPAATLRAYRPDGTLIGEVQNGGGSRYGGTVMPYQPSDPGTITIRSSSGGSVTVPTGPFKL